MSAELTTIKLNTEEHLLLDQPLLRLPIEVNRSNFKAAQIEVDKAKKTVLAACKTAVGNAHNAVPKTNSLESEAATAISRPAITAIDSMIQKTNILKRKLSAISSSTDAANISLGTRIKHLDEVQNIPSLSDVKYDEWSKTRLDRLLVDHLLRQGFTSSAKLLAKQKGIEDLVRVEIEAFEACSKIERSLREGQSTKDALIWCDENKKELSKLDSDLRFELRLQQFIELIRKRQTLEALAHGQKYLANHKEWALVERAAGLMIFSTDVQSKNIQSFFSRDRWRKLADLFVHTHHQMFNIPAVAPLNTSLSIGLSALKTPACHSKQGHSPPLTMDLTNPYLATNGHSNGTSGRESLIVSLHTNGNGEVLSHRQSAAPSKLSDWTTPICPICSTELNSLAKDVPYALHSKSYVDHDPVVLPNGRIFGTDRLERANMKLGTPQGKIRDPLDGTLYDAANVRKVFIT